MNRKTKRTIIFICVAVLLIAAAFYFIPFPTRVNVQMTGIEVTADGTYKNEYTVQLNGWKLNYLFKDDEAQFDAQITGINSLELNNSYQSPIPFFTRLSDEFDYFIWDVYSPVLNRFDSVQMCLSKNADWLVIHAADRYFVAAADANADLQAYWEMCADQIR